MSGTAICIAVGLIGASVIVSIVVGLIALSGCINHTAPTHKAN